MYFKIHFENTKYKMLFTDICMHGTYYNGLKKLFIYMSSLYGTYIQQLKSKTDFASVKHKNEKVKSTYIYGKIL